MRRNAPLELVHTDVCQVDTKSHAGAQYFVRLSSFYARACRNEAGPPGSQTKEQVIERERERETPGYE